MSFISIKSAFGDSYVSVKPKNIAAFTDDGITISKSGRYDYIRHDESIDSLIEKIEKASPKVALAIVSAEWSMYERPYTEVINTDHIMSVDEDGITLDCGEDGSFETIRTRDAYSTVLEEIEAAEARRDARVQAASSVGRKVPSKFEEMVEGSSVESVDFEK